MIGFRPPRDCRRARKRMSLRYYAALDPSEDGALERHLESCPACAREWDALRRALDAADAATIFPREAEVDWREFERATVARARAAAALAERAPAEAPRAGRHRPWRVMLPAAARVLVLGTAVIVAVMILNTWLRPGGPRPPRVLAPRDPGGEAARPASLLESAHAIEDRLARQGAARYLRDSRALLMNLVGAAAPCRRTDGRYDITLEKEKSRQLLRRQNLYEGDLLALEDQRLATLVRQLESVLLQVTALDDCAPARQIHDLRDQIESREILLRIDLLTRAMQRSTHVV